MSFRCLKQTEAYILFVFQVKVTTWKRFSLFSFTGAEGPGSIPGEHQGGWFVHNFHTHHNFSLAIWCKVHKMFHPSKRGNPPTHGAKD